MRVVMLRKKTSALKSERTDIRTQDNAATATHEEDMRYTHPRLRQATLGCDCAVTVRAVPVSVGHSGQPRLQAKRVESSVAGVAEQ